jgi:hypothetical protein
LIQQQWVAALVVPLGPFRPLRSLPQPAPIDAQELARQVRAVTEFQRTNRMALWLTVRPILLAFQFGGRSTRTEVVAYYLLSSALHAFSFS